MKLTFLGHACFTIESGAYTLMFDPYLTGNPAAAKAADEVEATHILVSHGHNDHIADAQAIADRCGATVYATVETAKLLSDETAKDVGQIGGSVPAPFGRVKWVSAAHGSGVAGGLACGFVVELEGKRVYFAGDTGLIMDMALLADLNLDLALLPIGDKYTMGPEDALRAVKLIRPKAVVPMHYNTWPPIAQDPMAFKAAVEGETGTPVHVLASGQTMEL